MNLTFDLATMLLQFGRLRGNTLVIPPLYIIGLALVVVWLFTSAVSEFSKFALWAGAAVLLYAIAGPWFGLPELLSPIHISL